MQSDYKSNLSLSYFGYEPHVWQKDGANFIINANGHDTIVLQRTGGGKSWMFLMADLTWLKMWLLKPCWSKLQKRVPE